VVDVLLGGAGGGIIRDPSEGSARACRTRDRQLSADKDGRGPSVDAGAPDLNTDARTAGGSWTSIRHAGLARVAGKPLQLFGPPPSSTDGVKDRAEGPRRGAVVADLGCGRPLRCRPGNGQPRAADADAERRSPRSATRRVGWATRRASTRRRRPVGREHRDGSKAARPSTAARSVLDADCADPRRCSATFDSRERRSVRARIVVEGRTRRPRPRPTRSCTKVVTIVPTSWRTRRCDGELLEWQNIPQFRPERGQELERVMRRAYAAVSAPPKARVDPRTAAPVLAMRRRGRDGALQR
jgi:hypothetical protein